LPTVRQNAILALGVKIAILLLSAVGVASMWRAIFADVDVTLLAIANAMRTMGYSLMFIIIKERKK
jgi:Cd2+/Zn2+-exporting ATPase